MMLATGPVVWLRSAGVSSGTRRPVGAAAAARALTGLFGPPSRAMPRRPTFLDAWARELGDLGFRARPIGGRKGLHSGIEAGVATQTVGVLVKLRRDGAVNIQSTICLLDP